MVNRCALYVIVHPKIEARLTLASWDWKGGTEIWSNGVMYRPGEGGKCQAELEVQISGQLYYPLNLHWISIWFQLYWRDHTDAMLVQSQKFSRPWCPTSPSQEAICRFVGYRCWTKIFLPGHRHASTQTSLSLNPSTSTAAKTTIYFFLEAAFLDDPTDVWCLVTN